MSLEGPAPHPLVRLFEEFIFQNMAESFGSSFLVHLDILSVEDNLLNNYAHLNIRRFSLPAFMNNYISVISD